MRNLTLLCFLAAACGGSSSSIDGGSEQVDATRGGDAPDAPDAQLGARPHPQYPPLDLDTLPGTGGGAIGPYTPPTLPTTTRSVTVSSTGPQAAADMLSECQGGGVEVTVPNEAGALGAVNIGDADDCDVIFGNEVTMSLLVLGSLPGPMHAPVHRLRIRGGQVGNLLVLGDSSDVVLDGVVINNGVQEPVNRSGSGIYMPEANGMPVRRFVMVNSIIRLFPVDVGGGVVDGTAYLAGNAEDVMFANNNIVTSGNRNSWGFRIGGGSNTLLVDNTVRVSFHKLVRMNDNPVDYVYIKGGTWMRESTLTAGGDLNNDSFTQLSGSSVDNVFIHDPTVYLLADAPVSFGMTGDAIQSGKSWESRRIQWHALNDTVISDSRLTNMESYCTDGASCDYGLGSHSYSYEVGLVLPPNPWRDLPGIEENNPDNQPVAQ